MKHFLIITFILLFEFGYSCNCLETEINGDLCVNCLPEGWDTSSGGNGSEDVLTESAIFWPSCHGSSFDGGGAAGMFFNEGIMTTFDNLVPGGEYYIGFQIATCDNGLIEIFIGDYYEEFAPNNGSWEDVIFCFVAGSQSETLTIQGTGPANTTGYVLVDYLPCGSYNADDLDCEGNFGIDLEEGSVCPGEEHTFETIVGLELDGSEIITWLCEPPNGLDYLSDVTIIDPTFLLPEGNGETTILFEYTLLIQYLDCEGQEDVTVTILPEIIPSFSDILLCENDDINILPIESDDNFVGYWEGPTSFEGCGNQFKEFKFIIEEGQGNCLDEYSYELFITPFIIPEFSFSLEYCITDSIRIRLPDVSDNGISGEWYFDDFYPYNLDLGYNLNVFTPDEDDFPCSESIDVEIFLEEGEPIEFVLPMKFCKGDSYIFPDRSANGQEGFWSIPSIPMVDENGITIDTSGFLETVFISDEESCNDTYLFVFEIIDLLVDVIIDEPSDCEFDDGTIELLSSEVLEISLDNGLTWAPNAIISDLIVGTYNITYRRAMDSLCVDNVTVELMGGSLPIISPLEISNGLSCANATGEVVINSSEVLTLEFSIDDGISWQTNNTFENLPVGNYILIVRFLGSVNCYYKESFIIEAPEKPMIDSFQAIRISDCFLEDGMIEVLAIGTDLTYSIDNGVNWQVDSIFQNLSSGTYTVLVRSNSIDDCIDEIIVDIFEPTLPMILVQGNDPTSCSSNDGTIFITNTNPSVELEYSINGGITWQLDSSFLNLAGGLYIIDYRIADASSCTDKVQINLENLEGPEIFAIEFEDDTSCTNDVGFINIDASSGNEFSIDNGLTWQTSGNFTGLSGGSYTVLIRSIQILNCIIEQDFDLDEYELPVILSGLVTDISDCGQMDGAIEIIATGQDLEYSIDYGLTWQNSSLFMNLGSGIYGMMIRETFAPSCTEQEEVEVGNLDTPRIEIVNIENIQSCQENEGQIETRGIGNGDQLEYSIDGGISWMDNGVFENLIEGDYSIIVRYVDRPSCQDLISGSVLLIEQTLLGISQTTINPLTCGSSDGVIQFDSNLPGLAFSIDNGVTFQSGNIFTGLFAGIFDCQVQLENAQSCDTIFQIELLDPDCPCSDYDFSYETENIDCVLLEGSISLFLDVNENVLWENNSNETILQNLNAGWYFLTINYNDGICFHQDSIYIDSIDPINMTLEVFPSDCEGESNGNVVITETEGGDGIYNYSIDGINYQSESGFYNLSPDMYEVIVTDMGNCISREEFIIELSQQPFDILLPLEITVLKGEEVVLNPLIDVTSIDSFLWTPSEYFTTPQTIIATVSPDVTTEFTLTIFYGQDCIQQRSIVVNVESKIVDETDFYLPNVIQYSNSDNSIFYIQSPENYNGKILSMIIYDRWGNKVFFKNNPVNNNKSDGWDGTTNSNLVQGVYVYVVKYELKGVNLIRSGSVTMLR